MQILVCFEKKYPHQMLSLSFLSFLSIFFSLDHKFNNTYLRDKNWQVILNKWICIDNGLVEVLVEDLPGQGELPQVLGLQLGQRRADVLCRRAQLFVPVQQI